MRDLIAKVVLGTGIITALGGSVVSGIASRLRIDPPQNVMRIEALSNRLRHDAYLGYTDQEKSYFQKELERLKASPGVKEYYKEQRIPNYITWGGIVASGVSSLAVLGSAIYLSKK